jgi:hypothetical protein
MLCLPWEAKLICGTLSSVCGRLLPHRFQRIREQVFVVEFRSAAQKLQAISDARISLRVFTASMLEGACGVYARIRLTPPNQIACKTAWMLSWRQKRDERHFVSIYGANAQGN